MSGAPDRQEIEAVLNSVRGHLQASREKLMVCRQHLAEILAGHLGVAPPPGVRPYRTEPLREEIAEHERLIAERELVCGYLEQRLLEARAAAAFKKGTSS